MYLFSKSIWDTAYLKVVVDPKRITAGELRVTTGRVRAAVGDVSVTAGRVWITAADVRVNPNWYMFNIGELVRRICSPKQQIGIVQYCCPMETDNIRDIPPTYPEWNWQYHCTQLPIGLIGNGYGNYGIRDRHLDDITCALYVTGFVAWSPVFNIMLQRSAHSVWVLCRSFEIQIACIRPYLVDMQLRVNILRINCCFCMKSSCRLVFAP